MKTIYKYNIPITDRFELEMPKGAEILTVDVQDKKPVLWASVDTDQETETRPFYLGLTGKEIDNSLRLEYIGSFQLDAGIFVGHLFEIAMVIYKN